jgi:hypothetical protein
MPLLLDIYIICNVKKKLTIKIILKGDKMVDIKAQLKEHLKNAADWGKMETPVSGVFVVKVPATKTRPALLFLEINPLLDDGRPLKKRGLFVGNKEMLVKFGEALNDDKVFQLIGELEQVNPKVAETASTKKLEM